MNSRAATAARSRLCRAPHEIRMVTWSKDELRKIAEGERVLVRRPLPQALRIDVDHQRGQQDQAAD